jgi:hypothetical protein
MKKPLTERGVKRMREREASVGLDPQDPASDWLDQNEPKPEPPKPKSLKKSVTLHRFRQKQEKQGRA